MRFFCLGLVLAFLPYQFSCFRNDGASSMPYASGQNISGDEEKPDQGTLVEDGLYFGKSGKECNLQAWLFRVNGGRGALYMPPGSLRTRDLVYETKGQIRFQTEKGLAENSYIFEGYTVTNGIQGIFSLMGNLGVEKCRVKLIRIKSDLSTNYKDSPVRYSNVRYIPESGDLVGSELIILRDSENPAAVFTDFEGDMVPYAAKIKESKRNIEIRVQLRDEEWVFRGTISDTVVKLRDVSRRVDPNAATLTLIRKPFSDLFPDR